MLLLSSEVKCPHECSRIYLPQRRAGKKYYIDYFCAENRSYNKYLDSYIEIVLRASTMQTFYTINELS